MENPITKLKALYLINLESLTPKQSHLITIYIFVTYNTPTHSVALTLSLSGLSLGHSPPLLSRLNNLETDTLNHYIFLFIMLRCQHCSVVEIPGVKNVPAPWQSGERFRTSGFLISPVQLAWTTYHKAWQFPNPITLHKYSCSILYCQKFCAAP